MPHRKVELVFLPTEEERVFDSRSNEQGFITYADPSWFISSLRHRLPLDPLTDVREARSRFRSCQVLSIPILYQRSRHRRRWLPPAEGSCRQREEKKDRREEGQEERRPILPRFDCIAVTGGGIACESIPRRTSISPCVLFIPLPCSLILSPRQLVPRALWRGKLRSRR